ncbi:MAG: S1C family serine protease [Candidatus Izimaplasma sp.]|nr:S1C family serine protease [Candidatus Izimaplasma bacterium]
MKKIIIYTLVIFSVLGFGAYKVFAEETTISTTEEITTTEINRTYTYSNYNDLVDQLIADVYQDVYQDVYDDIYLDVLEQITQETYDQIYADIELGLYDIFDNPEVIYDAIQNKIYDVIEISNKSVIGVESYMDAQGVAIGSGVIYKHDEVAGLYYAITNNHVVEEGNSYKIRFENEEFVDATLLHVDTDADIALLSFSDAGLLDIVVSELGTSGTLQKGEIILASGHPKGFNFYGSITLGVVAGIDRFVEGESITFIQHDAAINSGNSGGPIYNLSGQVVGINVLKYATEEIEGMGFSIPIDLVKTIINEYESNN